MSLSVFSPLTIGSVSPTFGAVSLGVSPDNPFAATPLLGATPLLSPDFAASFKTEYRGGQFGLSAGYSNTGSLFTAAPTAGWNVGASVGYAGFYLHAGISDHAQQRLTTDASKGWIAGFGYEIGAFNVRLSYMTAQALNASDGTDSRTWMIGGIYQLSSRIRLNADAFTGRDARTITGPTAAINAGAPQGTGARVGVQLRF